MKQEDKDLLIRDICSRLPYKIKASFYGEIEECETWDIIEGIDIYNSEPKVYIGGYYLNIEDIKPYLFPMSSMTEEQEQEYLNTCNGSCTYYWTDETFDYLNKNHFDYRGLIPKGLANDATGLNIY